MSSQPGIYSGDPDVFETPDPPPQLSEGADDSQSKVVEQIPSGVNLSYGKFSGKTVDGQFVDFSDPSALGFRTELSDYQKLLLGRDNESVTDRLERLKLEVAELSEDIKQMKEKSGTGSSEKEVNPTDLASDVAALQKQLSTVTLDIASQGSVSRSQVAKYFMDHVDHMKGAGSEKDGQSGVTFELYCRQDTERAVASGQLQDIAERLTRLEKAVGSGKKTNIIPEGLHAFTSTRDISSTILALQARVSLLDRNQILEADTRLRNLLYNLEKVKAAKEKQPEEETSKKINELYDLVKKWDSICELVPDLIDRLVVLKEIHERGASLINTVVELETSQHGMQSELMALNDTLAQAKKSFSENLSAVQANFTALEKTLKK